MLICVCFNLCSSLNRMMFARQLKELRLKSIIYTRITIIKFHNSYSVLTITILFFQCGNVLNLTLREKKNVRTLPRVGMHQKYASLEIALRQSLGPLGSKSLLRQISRSSGGVFSNTSLLSSVYYYIFTGMIFHAILVQITTYGKICGVV